MKLLFHLFFVYFSIINYDFQTCALTNIHTRLSSFMPNSYFSRKQWFIKTTQDSKLSEFVIHTQKIIITHFQILIFRNTKDSSKTPIFKIIRLHQFHIIKIIIPPSQILIFRRTKDSWNSTRFKTIRIHHSFTHTHTHVRLQIPI